MTARFRHPAAPLVLLAVLSVLSLGARLAWLDQPCRSPCTTATDHKLIFDEIYYVNAAKAIAGIQPPRGAPYAGSPLGVDPNSEHPQLAKLVIAGSIELFGDGPFAWRIGSVAFGAIAILGMFALVRAAGGGRWAALAASGLMACDNLLLVHGRIGTLDVYVLAAMLWGVALYLRGRPLTAGVVLGVAACFKLVAPYALLVLVLVELLRRPGWRAASRRLAICTAAAAAVFYALLDIMDGIAPPYDPVTGRRVGGGTLGHIGHILSYSARQTSPHGPKGIASYPWQWLGDYKPITYLFINPGHPSPGLHGIHPHVDFLGMVNPVIMLLAIPGLLVAALSIVRSRGRGRGRGSVPGSERSGGAEPGLAALALAWFAGTWIPFELLSGFLDRTSYLYYMVIVMPGIYVAIVHLFERWRAQRWVVASYALLVLAAAIVMYPFTPLP